MGAQILRAPRGTAAQVRAAVAAGFSRVATSPAESVRFPLGPFLAPLLGSPEDRLQTLPPPHRARHGCGPVLAPPPIERTGEVRSNGA